MHMSMRCIKHHVHEMCITLSDCVKHSHIGMYCIKILQKDFQNILFMCNHITKFITLDLKSSYMFLHVVLKCDLLEKPNNQTGPIWAR